MPRDYKLCLPLADTGILFLDEIRFRREPSPPTSAWDRIGDWLDTAGAFVATNPADRPIS